MTESSLTSYWCFNYSNGSTLFLIHSKHGTTAPTVAPPMSIKDTFDYRVSMKNLLNRIGILSTCIIRLMQIEGFGSSRDLALTRVVDLKATVQNMNKLFRSSQRSGTKIYFPQIKVARIKALCVYLRRCLMINQILDVSLITLDKW